MLTLAFESSARPASVALMEDDVLVSQYTQCSALTHSRTLLPMAEDLLKNAEISIKDIDRLAVAQGPGSFTGIRIGISTVKGLAWALDKPCVGVSTLEAMAWNGCAQNDPVCCVMDARRSQVYNALFEIRNGAPVRLCEDRAISLEDLSEHLRQLGRPVFLIGDGTALTEAHLQKQGLPCRAAPENLRWQNAYGVAMAAREKPSIHVDQLLPFYLSLSQAERERQARLDK